MSETDKKSALAERLRVGRTQFLLILTDFLVVFAAYELSLFLRQKLYVWLGQNPSIFPYYDSFLFVTALVYIVSLKLQGLYRFQRSHRAADVTVSVIEATFQGLIVLIIFSFFLGFDNISRTFLVTNCLLTAAFLALYRPVIREAIYRGYYGRLPRRKVLLLGASDRISFAKNFIREHRELGYLPYAFVPDAAERTDKAVARIRRTLARRGIKHVINLGEETIGIYRAMDRQGVQGIDAAPVFRIFEGSRDNFRFRNALFCTLGNIEYVSSYEALKRLVDVAVSLAALVLCLPLLAAAALAVKLDSRGPVFFRQKRVGRLGRVFWVYKFRTMRAEQCYDAPHPQEGSDPRVTALGRFLRATSIDELPQLINVLKGEMSLVGPRPEMLKIVNEEYEPWHFRRLLVKPGITGLWQINGRLQPIHEHMKYDLGYIKHASMAMDLMIMLKTVPAVIRKVGAR